MSNNESGSTPLLLKPIAKYWPRHPYITCGVVALILYLTLFPDPVPDNDLGLIPGIDKVVHAIMFGAFAFALLLDISRHKGTRLPDRHTFVMPTRGTIIAVAVIATLFGGFIELLQQIMGMGRSADLYDFAADFAGVVAAIAVAAAIIRRL